MCRPTVENFGAARDIAGPGPSSERGKLVQINRREFLDLSLTAASVLSTAPFVSAAQPAIKLPKISSTFGGVPLGCGSISFMDTPIEGVPALIAGAGYGLVEIIDSHMQPPFGRGGPAVAPAPAPAGGANPAGGIGRGGSGRAMDPETRAKLRDWRMTVPLTRFEEVSGMFRAKNIYVYSYHSHFTPDFTDAEIDRVFEMAHTLGCQIMTAATVRTNEFALRLDPYAQKHKMRVGIHNLDANLSTVAQYDEMLHGCSDYMGINFDIGHWADADADCVDLLRRRHDSIVELHIKGKRGSTPPGKIIADGDNTAKDVLLALRDNKWPIPSVLEYEVRGTDRVVAVKEWFDYSKGVLLS
jgi:sugar phosphate isomerase/epimerase